MTKEKLLNMAKPILFNTEMVKAILDNKKTVTRRKIDRDIVNRCDMENDGTLLCYEDEYGDHIRPEKLCRYKPGDILYIRETWTYHEAAVGGIIYKARCPQKLAKRKKWHPSIHMPKEAARIFLKVTDVRVERLQDINFKGICCEGLNTAAVRGWDMELARDEWELLWDSTIKKSDLKLYGWDANPYVWVIEFERIEVEE